MSQPLEALALANEVRFAKGALKVEVAAGRVLAVDVIAEMPEGTRSMTAFELLKSQHQWGRQRTLRALRSAGIPEAKLLTDLTDRQRAILPRHI